MHNNIINKRLLRMRYSFALGLITALITIIIGGTLQTILDEGVRLSFWAFPMNLFCCLVIMLIAIILRYRFCQSAAFRLLRNPYFASGVIGMTICLAVILGTVVQSRPVFGEIEYFPNAFSSIVYSIVNSWPFVMVMLLLMFILCIVVLGRKFSFSLRYFSFQFNHIGLLLLMIAGIIGAPDKQEYKMILTEGHIALQVFDIQGERAQLPFEIEMKQFETEHFVNKLTVVEFDTVSGYAFRQVQQELFPHTHHYTVDGFPITVLSEEIEGDTLTVEVGEERWQICVDYSRGFVPLAGNKALTLTKGMIRRYIAQLEVTNLHTNQSVKETVLVNHPWVYDGYYIYLESYNPQQGLVVRISKDNWLWLAYIGLWMLIAGAVIMFVIGPVGFVYDMENKKIHVEPIEETL